MTTMLDTLVAAAMEREQADIRADELRRKREEERRADEQRGHLRELLDASLSEKVRAALDLTIEAAPNGAWAEFVYADRRFQLQRGGNGGEVLCLKAPAESYLLQIGHVHPSVGKLDELLLRALGRWREKHAVSGGEESIEEEYEQDSE